MNAQELYGRLNADFIKDGISDYNWAARMPVLDKYLHPEFRQSGMGLLFDFADSIEKVYTTVFLSDEVLETILSSDTANALIFSHHPTNWDIEGHGGNYAATERIIAQIKERNIAVYVLHHPLDNYSPYATCQTMADAVGLQVERPAFLYCGAWCGVIGTMADCPDIYALQARFATAVGHRASLYPYGHHPEHEHIQGQKIAVAPGGGNVDFVLEEMLRDNIKILMTGVTLINEYSAASHTFARENGITLLGGTHYSTEKFAPMAMCRYFAELGLAAEFIEDAPKLYDI